MGLRSFEAFFYPQSLRRMHSGLGLSRARSPPLLSTRLVPQSVQTMMQDLLDRQKAHSVAKAAAKAAKAKAMPKAKAKAAEKVNSSSKANAAPKVKAKQTCLLFSPRGGKAESGESCRKGEFEQQGESHAEGDRNGKADKGDSKREREKRGLAVSTSISKDSCPEQCRYHTPYVDYKEAAQL